MKTRVSEKGLVNSVLAAASALGCVPDTGIAILTSLSSILHILFWHITTIQRVISQHRELSKHDWV